MKIFLIFIFISFSFEKILFWNNFLNNKQNLKFHEYSKADPNNVFN